MQLARVIGDVVATIKDQNLEGHRLLILQPVTPDAGRQPAGRTLVAIDSTGSGVGEYVFFVRGREASFPFLPAAPPVDACVVGIVDRCDVEPVTPQVAPPVAGSL
jgi:ethanolamine utilization protein EutN